MKKTKYGTVLFYTACFIVLIFGGIVLLSALGVELIQSQTRRIEAQAELKTAQAAADVLRWRQKEDERQERNDEAVMWFAILSPQVWVLFSNQKTQKEIAKINKKLKGLMRRAK